LSPGAVTARLLLLAAMLVGRRPAWPARGPRQLWLWLRNFRCLLGSLVRRIVAVPGNSPASSPHHTAREEYPMRKIIIAEDDLYAAETIECFLRDSGYDVCGIAPTVEAAIELGERHKPHLAILDIRLANGGLGMDIAARFNQQEHRLGILYATGKIGQIHLTKAHGDAYLGKPYRPEDLLLAVKIVEEIASTGRASQPFPLRFRVLD
jgi:CheY-like chemotaxis protein